MDNASIDIVTTLRYHSGIITYPKPMTTIQVRIDEKTKRSAKKVLDRVGLDMSSAIKLYLKQLSIRQGLPFTVLTENGLTPEEEDAILIASEEARKGINVSPAMEADEAIEYLKKL